MQGFLRFAWIVIILIGCNLLSTPSPTPDDISINITVNPAPTQSQAEDTNTIGNNPTTSEQVTSNPPAESTSGCQTPLNWVTYTVQSGDTLFGIAQSTGSSVAELTRAKCLESADTLDVGQVLFVPQAIEQDNESIVYWVGSATRINDESVQVGCETYLNPVRTYIIQTGNSETDIEAVLTALFNQTATSPYQNLWTGLGLSVADVTVNDGLAEITLNGDMLLVGVCGDAELSSALVFSLLTNADVERFRIRANGVKLAQLFDMSGRSGADAVFDGAQYDVPTDYR